MPALSCLYAAMSEDRSGVRLRRCRTISLIVLREDKGKDRSRLSWCSNVSKDGNVTEAEIPSFVLELLLEWGANGGVVGVVGVAAQL